MSRPRLRGRCSCGHKFRPIPPTGGRGRLDSVVLVDLLNRRPDMVGISPLADSVDQSVRWSA